MAAPRKILALTMEFELGERKTHGDRLKNAHEKALDAAIEAVKGELLDDSVEKVNSHMTWSYRYLDQTCSHGREDADHGDIDPQGTEAQQDE